jgi:5,6-dimethylbenzimidazole synthase
MPNAAKMGRNEFEAEHKEGVYKAIHLRRDIRAQFLPDPIPENVLARILNAAHHAPSVGFSQPWDFVLVRDHAVRQNIHAGFVKAHQEAAEMFAGDKREQYRGFKLEGILESPLNVCVTYDRSRFGPVVVGRTASPQMGVFSSICAVQNLWLAARAEGLGVGWVSIIHDQDISDALALPDHIIPAAYLCVGYVSHFPGQPELETVGWLPRVPLEQMVAVDRWGANCQRAWPELHRQVQAELLR